jgi:hypothetical protein
VPDGIGQSAAGPSASKHGGDWSGAAAQPTSVSSLSIPPVAKRALAAAIARDLIAGNLVGAYELAKPASTPASRSIVVHAPSLAAPGQLTAPRRAHQAPAAQPDEQPPPPPEVVDATRAPHDSRGPQGGGLSAGGGGGAASELALMIAFAFVAATCLAFLPRPCLHLPSTAGYRLERPG